jgi:hypothetical protein
MIIVKVWGGLGNQLFQYAFGQYLSTHLNTPVKYDIQTTNKIKNFTARAFGFNFLNINIDVASAEEVQKMRYFKKQLFLRLQRKLAQYVPVFFPNYIVENVVIHGNQFQLRDNCYYDGYWQYYKYLYSNEIKLHKEISLKSGQSAFQEIMQEITSSEAIGIHVRRGDYITVKKTAKIYKSCSPEYYQKAMNHFRKIYSAPKFFVFSDDLDWVKQNFTGTEFVFISGNEPEVDMLLMSKCRHNIIANSTFSWWGGWLNQHKEKIVICPEEWYNGKLENKKNELIPPQWIRM